MKQSKKKNSHPTNTSHATAHLLADPEKMDNELDSLFASSVRSFPSHAGFFYPQLSGKI
jgi:hypothetical protein